MTSPTTVPHPASSFWRDVSASAVAAGFIAILVGYTSAAVIVFQAAKALGADSGQIASWMWALGIGMGITCIGLSLRYRMPVVTAWSTPGAAMLAVGGSGLAYSDAVGGFLLSALLMAVAGFSGVFARSLSRIPTSLANGLLAGVLLHFGLNVFTALKAEPALVLAMLVTWLLARLWLPRYAVLLTLLAGIVVASLSAQLHLQGVHLQLARPEFVRPTLSLSAVFGIALPLFVVTMTSQNVPGVAVARANGYELPVSPVVGWVSVANLVLAPFGAYALNLAAITAAICMGREAHHEPARRYVAAVAAGGFYLLAGVFGATIAALLGAFPQPLVLAIAGIALFGTIANSLAGALREEGEREPALVAFLVTASGVSFWGIGSAFWGLLAGATVLLAFRRKAHSP